MIMILTANELHKINQHVQVKVDWHLEIISSWLISRLGNFFRVSFWGFFLANDHDIFQTNKMPYSNNYRNS